MPGTCFVPLLPVMCLCALTVSLPHFILTFCMNLTRSIITALGMNESPLDSNSVCCLLGGMPIRLKTFSCAQEKQSGLTHLSLSCGCFDLSFLDFLFCLLLPLTAFELTLGDRDPSEMSL